jgi:hypothetical protein
MQESKANFSMTKHILPVWKIYHEILMQNFYDSKNLLPMGKTARITSIKKARDKNHELV